MRWNVSPWILAAAMAAACGDGEHGPMTMMGPAGAGSEHHGSPFLSVTPAGGSTGVPTSTSITIRFGGTMGVAMERYVDLHVESLAGPVVAMRCSWSPDGATLTCTPDAALEPLTTYVVHLGGGMTTRAGAPVDFGPYGPMMGGRWVSGGAMGGSHAGQPWGMLDAGWHHANGSYGMAFSFTTA